jgi:hypothetical protein
MNDAPDPAPVPPDSPALRAAQQALEAALADQGPEPDDLADPADPAGSAQDPATGFVASDADLAERTRRLAQAQQALAALLDAEPPGSARQDDAEG